jgi:hypothetical protein
LFRSGREYNERFGGDVLHHRNGFQVTGVTGTRRSFARGNRDRVAETHHAVETLVNSETRAVEEVGKPCSITRTRDIGSARSDIVVATR